MVKISKESEPEVGIQGSLDHVHLEAEKKLFQRQCRPPIRGFPPVINQELNGKKAGSVSTLL